MIRLLIVVVLLVAVINLSISESVSNETLIDYRLKYRRPFPLPPFACTATGLACENCRHLVYCRSDGNDGWDKEDQYSCPNDEICVDGRCTKTPSPACSPWDHLEFPCGSSGMFPNPGDCQRYHFCIPDIDVPQYLTESRAECLPDYGYNPKTTFCDKKLTNQECKGYPVPFCKHLGDVAALRENSAIYYECSIHIDDDTVLYPYLKSCPNGKPFNPRTGCPK